MFSSNTLKITLITAATLISACGFWQAKSDVAPMTVAPFVAPEIKSDVPFSTKEPEIFQTEISVTAGGIENVTFVAKNGANCLTIYDYRSPTEFALLKTGDNRNRLINYRRKTYAEEELTASSTEPKSDVFNDFLTAELLNDKTNAAFENLGAENGLTKYRARLGEAANSEIVISVDEKIGLPVKQEFYAAAGEQKTLTLTIELKNLKSQTEPQLHETPKDYRKVSLKEFQEMLRRDRSEK